MDLTELPGKEFGGQCHTHQQCHRSGVQDAHGRGRCAEPCRVNCYQALTRIFISKSLGGWFHSCCPIARSYSSLPARRLRLLAMGNQVELRKVTLGRDFGDTVEILSGVTPKVSVVANPPDSLLPARWLRSRMPRESRPVMKNIIKNEKRFYLLALAGVSLFSLGGCMVGPTTSAPTCQYLRNSRRLPLRRRQKTKLQLWATATGGGYSTIRCWMVSKR